MGTASDFNDIIWTPSVQQKAKTALREQNKREWVCELVLVGSTNIATGSTFMIEGFGQFNGKYIIETAEHRITGEGGYTTTINARRILEGY